MNERQTLKEFYEDYECERKFDGKNINMIIDGRLSDLSYTYLVMGEDSKYHDYFVVNWVHGDNHMIIEIASNYEAWLKMIEYRDEAYKK